MRSLGRILLAKLRLPGRTGPQRAIRQADRVDTILLNANRYCLPAGRQARMLDWTLHPSPPNGSPEAIISARVSQNTFQKVPLLFYTLPELLQPILPCRLGWQ